MNLTERLFREIRHCQDFGKLKGWPSDLATAFDAVFPVLKDEPGWMVTGGIAAGIHARPIGTSDLDIMAINPHDVATRVADHAGKRAKPITDAMEHREGYQIEIREDTFLDVIGPSDVPGLHELEMAALADPVMIPIPGEDYSLPVIPPGALLVGKVMVGRDRDRLHVRELIMAGHKDAALAVATEFLDDIDMEDVAQSIEEIELTYDKPRMRMASEGSYRAQATKIVRQVYEKAREQNGVKYAQQVAYNALDSWVEKNAKSLERRGYDVNVFAQQVFTDALRGI